MRAGQLRHRITLRRKNASQNSYNEEIITWVDVATVSAMLETTGGSEYIDAETAGAVLAHKITIRHYAGLYPTMRVIWGSRTFEIESVLEDNLKRETVLICSEAVSE